MAPGLIRCRFGDLCRSFQPPYQRCTFIHPRDPEFEYARGSVISSSDSRSRSRARRGRNRTPPPHSTSSRGRASTPPSQSRGRDHGWSGKLGRYSQSRSPEYRKSRKSPPSSPYRARSRSPLDTRSRPSRHSPRRSSPPSTQQSSPRQISHSPPRQPRAFNSRSSPIPPLPPSEPSFHRRRSQRSGPSSPPPAFVKAEPVDDILPPLLTTARDWSKNSRRETETVDLTIDDNGQGSQRIKAEQEERPLIHGPSPPPPFPIDTTPTPTLTSTMPPPPLLNPWGRPPENTSASASLTHEQIWEERLNLASEWIALETELREIAHPPRKAKLQRLKDITLTKLVRLSYSPASHEGPDNEEAQAIVALVLETKELLEGLNISLNTHKADAEHKADLRRAEKRQRRENPSKRDTLHQVVHDIEDTQLRLQALDNNLTVHTYNMELQMKSLLEDRRRAAANPANNSVRQMQEQLKALEDEIVDTEKELEVVDSEYANVAEQQEQVKADMERFQLHEKELKKDLAHYADLLAKLRDGKDKEIRRVKAMNANIKAHSKEPIQTPNITIDSNVLIRMVEEEVERKLRGLTLSVKNELQQKSEQLYQEAWRYVWDSLGPALVMCDALAKNTHALHSTA